jgi:hypothetical protein
MRNSYGEPPRGTIWEPPSTVWEPPSTYPARQVIPQPVTIFPEVTRADLEALRKEIAELKELLKERSK